MEATVRCSTLQEVNIPQLVGDERGTVFVPMSDWPAFLVPFSKPVKGIKQYHHFSFSHQVQGVAMATTHAEGPTQILPVLVGDAGAVPHAPPPWVQSHGLSAYHQWYLFKSIRDFCTDDTKDIMWPKPTVPECGSAPPTRQIAAPLPQGEADPEGGVDAPARGAWPWLGSGPRSWPSKGTFVLQIDFATVIIIDYYCPCYILTYIDFGTIMLSLQILIWTAKSSRQNVIDFLHDFITFY